ncbi:hypothetical protein IKF28_02860 [Candidatus Saccharibacteria bacterium]|nr:hypothetical protein [Candidatus Saccharibacteria bacterium]MBR3122358.1 hypothetical protein [Candidatus Saccharibacteria bacterium]
MSSKAKSKKTKNNEPFYKKWWFWTIIIIIFIGMIYGGSNNEQDNNEPSGQGETELKDYVGQDAKNAYDELTAGGYSVKFVFDRKNNGGFSEEQFQDYVINDSFGSKSYSEMPFIVTKQSNNNKTVTLSIDYKTAIEANNKQQAREAKLEEKLGSVEAMTACKQYGKRNYRNFKLHDITGKMAEYPSDDNTWLFKYYVDANGYKNMTMECYVTGTSENPKVSKFMIY